MLIAERRHLDYHPREQWPDGVHDARHHWQHDESVRYPVLTPPPSLKSDMLDIRLCSAIFAVELYDVPFDFGPVRYVSPAIVLLLYADPNMIS